MHVRNSQRAMRDGHGVASRRSEDARTNGIHPWSQPCICRAMLPPLLEVDVERAEEILAACQRAREVVDAENPAEAFWHRVRFSIWHGLFSHLVVWSSRLRMCLALSSPASSWSKCPTPAIVSCEHILTTTETTHILHKTAETTKDLVSLGGICLGAEQA